MNRHIRPARAGAAIGAALLAVGLAAATAAQGNEQPIVVRLDEAKVAKLPDKAQTLIVGNPIIADVTLLKGGGTMVITGKGFGETNLIVLDSTGNVLDESTIRVVAASGSVLIVQRGVQRETYSCMPRCQPTVQLGDDKGFSGDAASQIQQRNGLSAPQTPGH
jgi:Flp pilus assembly secretin CpaC